jgi:hypothetical protein
MAFNFCFSHRTGFHNLSAGFIWEILGGFSYEMLGLCCLMLNVFFKVFIDIRWRLGFNRYLYFHVLSMTNLFIAPLS